ncbi:glycosyltransferase family 4 protein [Patescibacteria group bacterium]|nr:glycosyltransferase family 4 protein [Patescibacteria group bacterium]
MKIAQLVSNYHRVSPSTKQAIYSLVAALSNGLTKQNNEVTLFASGDSISQAKLISVTASATYKLNLDEPMKRYHLHNLISECYRQADSFDIIHSHFNLLSSFYADLVKTPSLKSLHSPINTELKPLLKKFKHHNYISFSLAQRKQMPELNWVANIYHGVDTHKFKFKLRPKNYLMYLGRITEDKGVHLAIEAAQAAKLPLVIAGMSYENEGYWHNAIESKIDGKNIIYAGQLDFDTKIEYLRNARGLLFPTQYDEVFGLVMIEAMACGTPVIGWKSGSVPEIIQHKQTGYVIKSVTEMVKAISHLGKINRQAARQRVENLFSIEKMVLGYEKVYQRIVEEHRQQADKNNLTK